MASLAIEGWAVAHGELERSWRWGTEPDQVFLLRSPRCWTLVTLATASRPEADGAPSPGRAALSAEAFVSLDDVADAVRDRYHEVGWLRLLDAGRDDPELHRAWAPTRIERDFDQSSLHRPDLAHRGTGRAASGWHVDAVEDLARHLGEAGYEVARVQVAVDVDESGDANPVLGVLAVARYGVDTPGVVRVDDAGEVYVRPPFDDPVSTWELVDVEVAAMADPAGVEL